MSVVLAILSYFGDFFKGLISNLDTKIINFAIFLDFHIIQIFTAHLGNGAKYLPKVTGDREPTIARH